MIGARINEALSAATLLDAQPELLLRILMPPVVISLFALGAAWLMRSQITRPLGIALIQSFVVVMIGFAFAQVQIRAANLMTPALPFLAGFLVYAFTAIPRAHRLRGPAALALIVAMPAVLEAAARVIGGPPEIPTLTAAAKPDSAIATSASFAFCRNEAALAEIATLPTSLVFSSGNLSTAIMVYTEHSITSAGYHRSAAAFHNAFVAFDSRDLLRNALATSGADYLVICVNAGEERFIDSLAAEGWPNWLVEVTEDRKKVRLFKVDKAALLKEAANP
jgi:hypothetical protein